MAETNHEEKENSISLREEASNQENDNVPKMILTIDVGNGKIEQLKIFDLSRPEKDIYDFCLQNKLDFFTMEEISKQIHEVIDTKNKEIEGQNQSPIKEQPLTQEEPQLPQNDPGLDDQVNYNISETENLIITKQSRPMTVQATKKALTTYTNQSHNSSGLFPYQLSHSSVSERIRMKKSNSKKSARSKVSSSTYKICHNTKPNESGPFPLKAHNPISEPTLTIPSSNIIDPVTLIENEIVKEEDNFLLAPYAKKKKENDNVLATKKIKPKNYGPEIYERNLKAREDEQRRLETLRDTLNQSDEEIYTFHPKINDIPQRVLNKRSKEKKEYNNLDRILHYKDYYQEKLKKIKEKQQYGTLLLESENCTFKPTICKKSHIIEEKKHNSSKDQIPSNRFEKLYKDTIIHKDNLKHLKTEINDKYTYKPAVNDTSRIKQSFHERLENYKTRSKAKYKKIERDVIEERKREYLFQPSLHRPKQYETRKGKNKEITCDVFTNLYLYSKRYKENKKKLETDIYKKKEHNKASRSSAQIIGDKRTKVFKQLFTLLDGDGDNLITSISVNINRIPENIRKILEPIFKELKEENETLNEIEFVSVCEQLYQMLPYDKKREFIIYGKTLKDSNTSQYINGNATMGFKPSETKKKKMMKETSRELLKDISNISKISGELQVEGQMNTLPSKI